MCPKPIVSESNPGKIIDGKTGFSTGGQDEDFNMVDLAAIVLGNRNHEFQRHDSWLALSESGYILQPRLVQVIPDDDGSVQTVSTMEVSHPTQLPIPLFEFQHSVGRSIAEAVTRGFEQWATVDLPVFLELSNPTPKVCMEFMQEMPRSDGKEARTRRLLLGPLQYGQVGQATPANGDEHAWSCTCCLLFKNMESFGPVLESDDFVAIRLYALRSEAGQTLADCRVNGRPWPPGKAALERYVASWPGSGLAYKRQYVIAHNKDDSSVTLRFTQNLDTYSGRLSLS